MSQPVWNAFTGRLEGQPSTQGFKRSVHLAIDTAAAVGAATAGYWLTPSGGSAKRRRTGLGAPSISPAGNITQGIKRKLDSEMPYPKKSRQSMVASRRFRPQKRFAGYGTVKSIVNATRQEKRYISANGPIICGTTFTSVSSKFDNISEVLFGTGVNQREKESIYLKRLSVLGKFNLPVGAGTDQPMCRLVMVQCIADSLVDSVGVNEYFDVTAAVPVGIGNIFRQKANENWFVYKTLADKIYKIHRPITGGQGSALVHFQVKDFGPHTRMFFGNNATNPKINGIYIIAFSENSTVSFEYTSTLHFTE